MAPSAWSIGHGDFGYGAFYHYATEPYNQGWDKSFDSLMDRAVKEIDREAAGLNAPFLVLDDALDHQHITKAAPWLAKKLSEHYGCWVVFQPLDQLVRELEPYRDQLPVKEGELAETSHLAVGTNILLTYILSSRYDIKQANDQTQTLWEKWAEPLAAIHSITGRRIRSRFPPHRLSGADAQPRPRFPLRLFGGRSSPGYALPVPAGFRHCGGDHR